MPPRSSRRSTTSHDGYGDDVSTRFDAVILGLGIHGSASAYELARRGLRVAGIERFPAGHDRGSSHGATRMIRRAYPHPDWNEFVRHAYRGWERWERRAGRDFVHRTTGVFAHRSGGGLQGGGSRAASLDEVGELLPGLRLPDGYHATFDPDAGVVEAAAALAWAQGAAATAGAGLSFGETVVGWAHDGDGVRVTTDRRELRADRLVVAGGPWLARLLPCLGQRTEVWRILTYSARPGQAAAQSPVLGAFSVDLEDGLVFGLPEVAGAGAKIGVDAGAVWDPEIPVLSPTPEEADHLARLLARFAPGVDVAGGEAAACLYTMTPDKRFVIGAVA